MTPIPIMKQRTLLICLSIIALIAFSFLFIDRPLSIALRGLNPGFVHIFAIITNAAKSKYWIMCSFIVAACLWLLSRRSPYDAQLRAWSRMAIFAFAALVCAGLATDIIKDLLGRARPVLLMEQGLFGFFGPSLNARYQSMPSGHSETAMVLALLVRRFWPRYAKAGFAIALVLMASRLIVEAHYLSDVMAGALVGWLSTCVLAAECEKRGFFARVKAG